MHPNQFRSTQRILLRLLNKPIQWNNNHKLLLRLINKLNLTIMLKTRKEFKEFNSRFNSRLLHKISNRNKFKTKTKCMSNNKDQLFINKLLLKNKLLINKLLFNNQLYMLLKNQLKHNPLFRKNKKEIQSSVMTKWIQKKLLKKSVSPQIILNTSKQKMIWQTMKILKLGDSSIVPLLSMNLLEEWLESLKLSHQL